jgi:hypothetical protein
MVDYTKGFKGHYIEWLIKHRTKFKGIKPKNADIIIHIFTMAGLWTTNDQYMKLYEYICESFDIDKDEKHFVNRSVNKKKSK